MRCYHMADATIVMASQLRQQVSLCSLVKVLCWGLTATDSHMCPSVMPLAAFSSNTFFASNNSSLLAGVNTRSSLQSDSSIASQSSHRKWYLD